MRSYVSDCLLAFVAAGFVTAGSSSLAAIWRTDAVARGRDVARRSGCLSCHGSDLAGRVKIDDPTIAILYSSNLTRVRAFYTDRQLDRTIRTAIRPDGSRLWFMAAPYANLTRSDMADLIAYIRSVPVAGVDHGRIRMGQRFINAVAAKKVRPEALEQADDRVVPPDFGARYARGRYLARTICAGCHYPSLNGRPDAQPGDAPNLTVAAAYGVAEFRTLLRTGIATGHRKVGVMTDEAPKRFGKLSDTDVDALHAYLVKRAGN